MEDLATNIMGSREIRDFIEGLMELFAGIGYGFAVLFLLINVAIIYVQSLMGSGQLGWATIKPGLLRSLIVVGLLTAYAPFMRVTDGVFYGIYNDIKESREDQSRHFRDYIAKRQEDLARQEEASKSDSSFSTVDKFANPSAVIKESITATIVSYIHSIVTFLLGIVGVVALIIAWAQIQIFKIIGPLAMTFSILELWKGNWMKWFNGYVGGFGAMIVIVTLGLLQESMSSVILEASDVGLTAFIAIDIIMIGMYLAAFRIGSYIVGDAALGAIAPLTTVATSTGVLVTKKLGAPALAEGSQALGQAGKYVKERAGAAGKNLRESIRQFIQRKDKS